MGNKVITGRTAGGLLLLFCLLFWVPAPVEAAGDIRIVVDGNMLPSTADQGFPYIKIIGLWFPCVLSAKILISRWNGMEKRS